MERKKRAAKARDRRWKWRRNKMCGKKCIRVIGGSTWVTANVIWVRERAERVRNKNKNKKTTHNISYFAAIPTFIHKVSFSSSSWVLLLNDCRHVRLQLHRIDENISQVHRQNLPTIVNIFRWNTTRPFVKNVNEPPSRRHRSRSIILETRRRNKSNWIFFFRY